MFDNREKLENLAIFDTGAVILTLAKKTDGNSFVIILDELSNAFSVFLYD